MAVVGKPLPIVSEDVRIARELREPWIQQHPKYREAARALVAAEEAAKRVSWDDDPLVYVESVKRAGREHARAKQDLAEVYAVLKKDYDDQMGTGDE